MQDLTRSNCKEIKLVTTYLNDLETEDSESQQNAQLDKLFLLLYMLRSRELQGHIFEKYVLFTVIKSDKQRRVQFRRPGYWHFMLLRQLQVDSQIIRDCLPSQVSLKDCTLHPMCADAMTSQSRSPSVNEEAISLARSYSEISMAPSACSSGNSDLAAEKKTAAYTFWQSERSLNSNVISMITVLHYYALLESQNDSTEVQTKAADECVCNTMESLCLALEEQFGWDTVAISIARLCCYSFVAMLTNRLPELNRVSEKHLSLHLCVQRLGQFIEEFVFYRPRGHRLYARQKHLSLSSDVMNRACGLGAEAVQSRECQEYVFFLLRHIRSELELITIPSADAHDPLPSVLSCMFEDNVAFYTSDVARLVSLPALLLEKLPISTVHAQQSFGMHFGANGSEDALLLERYSFLLLKLGWNDDVVQYLHDAVPANMNNMRLYNGVKLCMKKQPPPPPPSAVMHPRPSIVNAVSTVMPSTDKQEVIVGSVAAPSVMLPPRMSLSGGSALKLNIDKTFQEPQISIETTETVMHMDIRVEPNTPTHISRTHTPQLARRASFSGNACVRGSSSSRLDLPRESIIQPPPPPPQYTNSPNLSPRPSMLVIPGSSSPLVSPRRDAGKIIVDKNVKMNNTPVTVRVGVELFHLEQQLQQKKLRKIKESFYEELQFFLLLCRTLKLVYTFPVLPSTVDTYPYENPLSNRYFQHQNSMQSPVSSSTIVPGAMLQHGVGVQPAAQSVLEITRLTAATHYFSDGMSLETDVHKQLIDQLALAMKKRTIYSEVKGEISHLLASELKSMICTRRSVFMMTACTTATELIQSADVAWKEEQRMLSDIPAWAPLHVPNTQLPLSPQINMPLDLNTNRHFDY